MHTYHFYFIHILFFYYYFLISIIDYAQEEFKDTKGESFLWGFGGGGE